MFKIHIYLIFFSKVLLHWSTTGRRALFLPRLPDNGRPPAIHGADELCDALHGREEGDLCAQDPGDHGLGHWPHHCCDLRGHVS